MLQYAFKAISCYHKEIFNVLSFELSNFSKNQQIVRDVCDQVLAGQGIGVFTYAKLRRLMEDESLRQLVCSKLNLGLDIKHSEEDFVQEMVCHNF